MLRVKDPLICGVDEYISSHMPSFANTIKTLAFMVVAL